MHLKRRTRRIGPLLTTVAPARALAVAASAVFCALLCGLAPRPAAAQTAAKYPDHPVRIIVPFPPGGAADTFSRLLASRLSDGWSGQSVLVDNRPGAAGIIGTEAAAKAPADGYTLLMVTVGHALNPAIYAKLPYDTTTAFVPVAWVANVPSLVVVGPAFDGKSLKDLIAAAKAKPESIGYASSGVGSTSHIGAALIESMTGADMLHVPYKGASAALQDVMGGRVAMSVDIITSSMQLVRSQKLRALATTGAKRSPLLPDVPTVAEAGIPGYDFTAWYMLLAPARTPPEIVARINAEARRIAAMPEFAAKIEEIGGEVASASPQDSAGFLSTELQRWAKLAKEKNIKAE